MKLSPDEIDAVGEATNIFAGAASCSFSCLSDVDIDLSVPDVKIWNNNSTIYNSRGYAFRFDLTAFKGGYCTFSINGNYERFRKLLGASGSDPEYLGHMLLKTVNAAVEPIERILERAVKVSSVKFLEEGWSYDWINDDDNLIEAHFEFAIEGEIRGDIRVLYTEKAARIFAKTFLANGIVITNI